MCPVNAGKPLFAHSLIFATALYWMPFRLMVGMLISLEKAEVDVM